MPLHKLSQKTFVNGQYDRTAQNQESVSGSNIVASGLSYAKNVLSSDRGELRKRLGTKFLKQLDGATVIVPFRNKENDDILLFSDGKLDILAYNENGTEAQTYTQYTDTKVQKTWTSNTVDGYTISVASRGTSGNQPYNMFQTPYYPTTGMSPSQQAAHPLVGGYEYLGDLAGGGIYPPNSFFAKLQLPSNAIVGKFSVIFATTHNSGSVPVGSGYTGYTNAVIQYSDDNITWTSANTIISSIVGNAPYYTWRNPTIQSGGVYTIDTTRFENIIMYDVILNENVGNHLYWRIYFTNPVDSHDRLYSQKLNIQFYTRSITTYSTITTDITNLKNIKYSQSGTDMKLVDGEHTPKTISLGAGYSYSNYTPSAPANFWTTWGNPSCVQYFQNRLWFSGFSAFPTTVVASKFNNISDFSYSTPAQTDDGLELKCNQLKSQISNLMGGQNILYCFSQDGISNIDGASNGLATNSNVEFLLKNRMPAGDATPAFKDDVMLYSSADGTKLYGLDFDLLVNRFTVADLAKYAKDITKAKITELHYVNNESKLVYGLTEEGSMFALLYEKGQYQGFFPLDFGGTVYDICPIKVGRDYKLLMVIYRDGSWYLEEKLDAGNYIDTSKPRMTGEEKKWATYDNLENNIALDCYQTYDKSITKDVSVSDNTIVTMAALGGYIGSSVMLGNKSDKDFMIVNIDRQSAHSVQTLYKWVAPSRNIKNSIAWARRRDSTRDVGSIYAFRELQPDGTESGATYGFTTTNPNNGTQSYVYNVFTNEFEISSNWSGFFTRKPENDTGGKYYWASIWDTIYALTNSETPNINDSFELISNGTSYQRTISYISYITEPQDIKYTDSATPSVGDNVYNTWDNVAGMVDSVSGSTIVINGRTYTRDSTGDMTRSGYNTYDITVLAQRGDSMHFDIVYPEFTVFAPNLPSSSNIGVISNGRYFNALQMDLNGNITLPLPCYKVIYGIIYESLGIIKIQTPYESLKNVTQVDVSVIDTTHLEIGTAFSDTENIEKIDDLSYYDLTRITMNDIYRQVISDTPEATKSIILRSNKGVPFTVIAVDVYVSYSNLGGD